jgi:hypothetical protein
MARTNKRAEKPSQQEGLADERLDLELSEAQRRTILKYADLPAHLAEPLSAQGAEGSATQFTLDELDELLDRLETAVYRAKGNEKQKVLRIVQKVAGLLGSEIIPSHVSSHRTSREASTIFQIKMTLKGIDPPIWRRVHTPDCTLDPEQACPPATPGHWRSGCIGGASALPRARWPTGPALFPPIFVALSWPGASGVEASGPRHRRRGSREPELPQRLHRPAQHVHLNDRARIGDGVVIPLCGIRCQP